MTPAHPHGAARWRMSTGQRLSVLAAATLLLVSGLGWLASRWLLRGDGLEAALPHPSEAWWLRLHGAALVAGLLALGSLLPGHVVPGLRHEHNRISGIATLAGCALLALSGYGLYYLTGEDWRAATSLVHWIAGLVVAPVLVLHVQAARRRAGALLPAGAARAHRRQRQRPVRQAG